MRMMLRWMAVVAVLAVSLGLATSADGKRTLKGTFNWTDMKKSGDLEAVFTPTGEGKWDVAFHFEFRGEPHTYAGTAEGSLSDGDLKGRVLNDKGNRTFIFKGTFDDGVFHGTHAEVGDDGEHDTGSLTLKS